MRDKIHFGFLFAGLATLVSASFQDNIRGPLLPVLCEQLGLPFSYGGLFLTIGNIAAVISTLAMGRALLRYSEKKVTIYICIFSAFSGIAAPFVDSLTGLLLLGLVLGASVALMGSICNILTLKGSPVHLRGRLLSIQQVMYGVGSFLGPMSFAWFYTAEYPWWTSISIVSALNVLIGLAVANVVPEEAPEPHEAKDKKSGFSWSILVPIGLFSIYVSGEVITSMWMPTYFVEVSGFSKVEASKMTSYFFLVISGSRFLSFLFIRPHWERAVMVISMLTGITFIVLGLTVLPSALPFAGLLGPFFPLFMASVSHAYPKMWKSLTIWIFASIQSSLAVIHLCIGSLTDLIGIEKAFFLSPVLIAISFVMLLIFFKQHNTEHHHPA